MQSSLFAPLTTVAALGFLFVGCSHAPVQTEPVAAQTSYQPLPSRRVQQDHHGFYYLRTGLATDYTSANSNEEKIRRDLQTVRDAGTYFLRVGFHWNEIEIAPEQYNWKFYDLLMKLADEYQVTLLPYLSHPPAWFKADDVTHFANFTKKVATRYQGRVPSWELWNEPDLQKNWPASNDAFLQMVSLAASAVREVDINAKVILGGMAKPIEDPFFKTLLDHTGFGEQFDVFNFRVPLARYPTTLRQVKNLVQFRAPGRDLWFAGFGGEASALWKSHILAATTESVSLTAWYPIEDIIEKKPAFSALLFFNKLFDQPFRSVSHRIHVTQKKNSNLWLEAYEKKDGQWVLTAWLKDPTSARQEETFSVELPQTLSKARFKQFTTTGQLISSVPSSRRIENLKIRGNEIWISTLQPEQQLSSNESK